MSSKVLSGGRLRGGTVSRASVCEFVELEFIGILKTEHTLKAYAFSILSVAAVYDRRRSRNSDILGGHRPPLQFKTVDPGPRISQASSDQTAHARGFS